MRNGSPTRWRNWTAGGIANAPHAWRSGVRTMRDVHERREPNDERRLIIATRFLADLRYWIDVDCRTCGRILRLMQEISRNPLAGIGKPEALRHDRRGTSSRRIDREHRVIYRFDREVV